MLKIWVSFKHFNVRWLVIIIIFSLSHYWFLKSSFGLSLIIWHFTVSKPASGSEFSWNQLLGRTIFKWKQEDLAKGDVSKTFSWCYWYSTSWWSELACCSGSPSRSSWYNSPRRGAGWWSWGALPFLSPH